MCISRVLGIRIGSRFTNPSPGTSTIIIPISWSLFKRKMFKNLIILQCFCVKDKGAVVLNASGDAQGGRVLGEVTPPPPTYVTLICSRKACG